jgi:hypothetical protein
MLIQINIADVTRRADKINTADVTRHADTNKYR